MVFHTDPMSMHDQETVSLSLTPTLGLESPREVIVPKQLGSVRLIREIGRGGMGVVWSGHDEMLGRDVAVKFLLGASTRETDPGFATFLEGARAAARLKCPGMTAIYHADVVEGSPYIVMEYVDGPTLAQVVHKSGPLTLPAAWSTMSNICGTVAELHDAGIIHRDIKPSNVMLDTDCNIFLTDFGVAICREIGDTGSERVGLAGTPAYMAPEAFDGYASLRTDTYALGMMFYELLAGSPAFDAPSLDQLKQMHQQTEPDLSKLAARKVDRTVIDVIERALRKDPKFRLKSARSFLEAMERASVSSSVRIRGGADLRAAALKCRTSSGADSQAGAASSAPGATPQAERTLYDHMSTIAAKKRANPMTPPAKSDSSVWGAPSTTDVGAFPDQAGFETPGHQTETGGGEGLGLDEAGEVSGDVKSQSRAGASDFRGGASRTGAVKNMGAAAGSKARADEDAQWPALGEENQGDEDAPLKPATIAMIGAGIFLVLFVLWLGLVFFGSGSPKTP